MSHPDRHSVRRVVLPSGKTIEVVYFDEYPVEDDVTAEAPVTPIGTCRGCESGLVYPLDWQEAGDDHWELTLRCPECESVTTGIFNQPLVEAFEEQLDVGTEQLVTDLRRLAQANMEDAVSRFAEALEADAILPMDF